MGGHLGDTGDCNDLRDHGRDLGSYLEKFGGYAERTRDLKDHQRDLGSHLGDFGGHAEGIQETIRT